MSTPSLRRRMACWLYEGLLMFGVVFIAGYLFGTLSQTRHALDNRHALQIFLFVIFGIYFVWFWAKGQTLAMKTWHIRVVDAAGRPLTQARALGRYALSWLWFLPPLVAMAPFSLSVPEITVLLMGWVAVVFAFGLVTALVLGLLGLPQLAGLVGLPAGLMLSSVFYISLLFTFNDSFGGTPVQVEDDSFTRPDPG